MIGMRKRSAVWSHFIEVNDKKARCRYCQINISFKCGSHGNLQRHMKAKHPFISIEHQQCEERQLEKESAQEQGQKATQAMRELSQPEPAQRTSEQHTVAEQPTISHYVDKPSTGRKAKQIDKQLVQMIAKGHHALRIVEEPEMKRLIQMVSHCPNYQLPCRKTVSEKILPQIYEELLAKAKRKVSESTAVCLTTDGWTSRINEHFIAVTAHLIDKNTNLCSILICCKQFSERHTSENLCNFLKEVMTEWQISHKIAAVVSDNAPNIINAVRLGEWKSIGCFAHLLNLIVQHGVAEISDVLHKVKAIVEFFNRSPRGLQKLMDVQRQLNLSPLKLKQDVSTRWNATYDMLERILKLKEAVVTTIALLRSDLIIDQQSWEIIEGALLLLKPFYEVTMEISSEKNVTLSKVIVFNKLIQNFLLKYSCQNEKVVALKESLKRGMQARFRNLEMNSLYAECTMLDPRFKQKGFKDERACSVTIDNLKRKIENIETTETEVGILEVRATSTADVGIESNIWDEYDENIRNISTPENTTAAGLRELDKYLNEDILNRKQDPLKWWHERKDVYPHLYKYVLKRFCIVATSVPCERVFSGAGQILNERRTLLKSNKLSNLMFLHSNM
ncbi:zinc finger BED domain-containing protein 1-like [Rhagoletis pomonella]|uniref:zinc finger BED domain-containing protein 1-like n=1 Tax=Rhagoletis pomonella TaxID=28610 RepID=UPI001783901E|nr:zinc finger BED domain-containing protein 1-like [Rhagoletis pomonella]